MEEAHLPLEGSEVILDWMTVCDTRHLTKPSISRAKWYWKVHLAAPDLDLYNKSLASRWLTLRELSKDSISDAIGEVVVSYLAHKP